MKNETPIRTPIFSECKKDPETRGTEAVNTESSQGIGHMNIL